MDESEVAQLLENVMLDPQRFEGNIWNNLSVLLVTMVLRIAGDTSREVKLRCYAMIVVKRIVEREWLSECEDGMLKAYVFEFVCRVLARSGDLAGVSGGLAKAVVLNCFFRGMWPDLPSVIDRAIGDPTMLRTGLVLASCVAAGIKKKCADDAFFERFAMSVVAKLAIVVSETTSVEMMGLCFDCMDRLGRFVPYGELMGAFVNKTPVLVWPCEDYSFRLLGVKAFKFFKTLLLKLPGDWVYGVLRLANGIVASEAPMPVRCSALAFVGAFMEADGTWGWLEGEFGSILVNMFFRLFLLSDLDLHNIGDDPVAFVNENEKVSTDCGDLKAGAVHILDRASKKHAVVVRALVGFSSELYKVGAQSAEDPNIVFAISSMCTAVMPKFSDQFPHLFAKACADVSHANVIRRAAAFRTLALTPSGAINREFFNAVLQGMSDASMVVRYYATTAFGHALDVANEEVSGKAGVQTMLGSSLHSLFEAVITLSSEFGDTSMCFVLFKLVYFFGEHVIPCASDLINKFIDLGVANAQAGCNADLSFQSVQEVVSVLARSGQDYGAIFQHAFQRLGACFTSVDNQEFIEETLLPTLKSFIATVPFSKSMWQCLELCGIERLSEFAYVIETLCRCDLVLMDTPEIPTALTLLLSSARNVVDVLPIVTGLFLRTTSSFEAVRTITPNVIAVILGLMRECEAITGDLIKAANAVVLFDPVLAMGTLGENAGFYVRFVIENSVPVRCGITQMTLMTLVQNGIGDNETKMAMAARLAELLFYGMYMLDDDYDSDDDDDDIWFPVARVMSTGHAFFAQCQEREPGLLTRVTQEHATAITAIPEHLRFKQ